MFQHLKKVGGSKGLSQESQWKNQVRGELEQVAGEVTSFNHIAILQQLKNELVAIKQFFKEKTDESDEEIFYYMNRSTYEGNPYFIDIFMQSDVNWFEIILNQCQTKKEIQDFQQFYKKNQIYIEYFYDVLKEFIEKQEDKIKKRIESKKNKEEEAVKQEREFEVRVQFQKKGESHEPLYELIIKCKMALYEEILNQIGNEILKVLEDQLQWDQFSIWAQHEAVSFQTQFRDIWYQRIQTHQFELVLTVLDHYAEYREINTVHKAPDNVQCKHGKQCIPIQPQDVDKLNTYACRHPSYCSSCFNKTEVTYCKYSVFGEPCLKRKNQEYKQE